MSVKLERKLRGLKVWLTKVKVAKDYQNKCKKLSYLIKIFLLIISF